MIRHINISKIKDMTPYVRSMDQAVTAISLYLQTRKRDVSMDACDGVILHLCFLYLDISET